MQNLLTAKQIKDADLYTIKHQSISSLDLMERACRSFVKAFLNRYPNTANKIVILCGQGNNGGDGLAIARLLSEKGYTNIGVYLINFSNQQSDDRRKNLERLIQLSFPILQVKEPNILKDLEADLVIDAVLGSGLNKPLEGKYLDLAKMINSLNKSIIAVDVPTGFKTEGKFDNDYNGIKADWVITFQQPKINFFFPESIEAIKSFKVVKIGLDEDFINLQVSDWKLTDKLSIQKLLKPRKNFTHKGTYGHVLLVAGNTNTMGAALLAAKACLHSGAGLTTLCLPQNGLIASNTLLPEVMVLPRNQDLTVKDFEKFKVIAIGPGLGVEKKNEIVLEQLISMQKPLVIDADGLTLLAQRRDLLDLLPSRTILTPHVKEFDRLFGAHENWWQRIETAKENAQKRDIIIVLKNEYTFICLPNGQVHINPTGNPAMASGGMGDVLTGFIASLLAQGYQETQAVILAVYLHGKTGDDLAKKSFVVTASQVALQIPKIMKKVLNNN